MPDSSEQITIPDWLKATESYEPSGERNSFVARSLLSVTAVLRHFRLDDGHAAKFSASAPIKLIFVIGLILLNSLSNNYLFTLIALALVLVRACLLPAKKLARTVAVSVPAALLAFVIMLPAVLIGQPHSAVLIATKTLVSVGAVMEMALGTPFNQLTGGLRAFHVPNLFIMTIDLALKNIVSLGNVAVEVLTSLKLRSVGTNRDKGSSMGGVAGIVFLKSSEAANDTFAAMTCRGYDGNYSSKRKRIFKPIDLAWIALFIALIALFVYLQGVIS